MKVSIGFRWFDLWVGVYIDRHNNAVYVCPLPTVVIKFQLGEPKPLYIENSLLYILCRDCQHMQGYHAISGPCLLCDCKRFTQPDNLASTVQH